MVTIVFPFRKEKSAIFGEIERPFAKIFFWSKKRNKWDEIWMIVDTGADYTLLPGHWAYELGIDLVKDCERYKTKGVGGEVQVFLFRRQKVKLGRWQKIVPIGFLVGDGVPPLLGRQDFLEKLQVTFAEHKTIFI